MHDRLRPALPISIHALREEGDAAAQEAVFLSTPSARRATGTAITEDYVKQISIRALREEGDRWTQKQLADATDFYPRPPRGGRPRIEDDQNVKDMISIHALREEGDPRTPAAWCVPLTISIHALREEGDVNLQINLDTFLNFYPRPPRGGRQDAEK